MQQLTQSSAPPFLRVCVNFSNLTCEDCLFIKWLLIKRKGINKILTPVSFVGRDAKCSCFIDGSIFQWFYKEMVVVFFSLLSCTPAFLSRLVSHINNSSKTLVKLTKFATEKHKSVQLAFNLLKKRKSYKRIC